jgi:hypothetical protein
MIDKCFYDLRIMNNDGILFETVIIFLGIKYQAIDRVSH